MGNTHRFLPGGDLAGARGLDADAARVMSSDDIVAIRELLPPGMGASPEHQAAMAWEQGDDEAARFAYMVADCIKRLKQG